MGYDDEGWADEVSEWERADAEFDILRDLALPLVGDAWREVAPSGTVHRLAPCEGDLHREAVFPARGQVAITLGGPEGSPADLRRDALALDLACLMEDALADGRPCPMTVVAALANDPRTVEIVHGLAVDIEWSEPDGRELVRFFDGDYVPLGDVISVRIGG